MQGVTKSRKTTPLFFVYKTAQTKRRLSQDVFRAAAISWRADSRGALRVLCFRHSPKKTATAFASFELLERFLLRKDIVFGGRETVGKMV